MQGCETLGCRIIKCTGSARGTNGGLKAVIAVCQELAPVAEEKGILVVLENHAKNVLERIEDYEEIFSKVDSPNIGMCLDTGHFEGANVDIHKVIDKFHERILHVDLKDCRQRSKGHDTVVFGQGVTYFKSFLQHLFERRYSGYLVVEQAWREPKGDWQSDLKKSYELFRSYQRD
jgi:sugar phosphate isomerase/epimerase